jgi:hypothetical protein
MAVRIDQAGQHGCALCVDHLRGRADQLRHIVANRHNQPVAHGHRRSRRLLWIHRVNSRIYNRQIGHLTVGASGREQHQKGLHKSP